MEFLFFLPFSWRITGISHLVVQTNLVQNHFLRKKHEVLEIVYLRNLGKRVQLQDQGQAAVCLLFFFISSKCKHCLFLLAKYTYIESWRGISLANSIFGFNGWSCSVVDLSPDFVSFWNTNFQARNLIFFLLRLRKQMEDFLLELLLLYELL